METQITPKNYIKFQKFQIFTSTYFSHANMWIIAKKFIKIIETEKISNEICFVIVCCSPGEGWVPCIHVERLHSIAYQFKLFICYSYIRRELSFEISTSFGLSMNVRFSNRRFFVTLVWRLFSTVSCVFSIWR